MQNMNFTATRPKSWADVTVDNAAPQKNRAANSWKMNFFN